MSSGSCRPEIGKFFRSEQIFIRSAAPSLHTSRGCAVNSRDGALIGMYRICILLFSLRPCAVLGRVLLCALAGCLPAGCTTAAFSDVAPPAEQEDLAAFTAAWADYANGVNETPHAADCEPRRFAAVPGTKRRGAVIMFHGFGSCPQQFLELAPRISAQRFDVLLPLLPGHGAMPTAGGEDDLSDLPSADEDSSRYVKFATSMNRIMAASPDEKIIVGFSFGGAISLNAALQATELYDRLLLLAPMLAIRGSAFVETLAEALGRTPGLDEMIVKPRGFRAECRSWQAAGRAGFCDYRYKHVVALIDLAQINRQLDARQPLSNPVQVVAAGDDDYVSNDRIADYASAQAEFGPISLCYMPADVPHEMLTPYENAGRDMYWLEPLLMDTTAFVVHGRFFRVVQSDGSGEGARCDLSY